MKFLNTSTNLLCKYTNLIFAGEMFLNVNKSIFCRLQIKNVADMFRHISIIIKDSPVITQIDTSVFMSPVIKGLNN